MDVEYTYDQGYGASRARRGQGNRRDDPYGGGGGGYDDYSSRGGGGYDRRGGRGGRGGRGSKPYDRRGGDGGDEYHQMEDPSGALTFRQFAFKHLPNDATPTRQSSATPHLLKRGCAGETRCSRSSATQTQTRRRTAPSPWTRLPSPSRWLN